ncbi:MAG: hypothetical protein WA324_15205, partial [Bryobacteraceae bacterium]
MPIATSQNHLGTAATASVAGKLGERSISQKRLAFLVNGSPDSAMAVRARSFARELKEYDVEILFRNIRKIAAIFEFLRALFRVVPAVVYVFDMSFSGVVAGFLYRFM